MTQFDPELAEIRFGCGLSPLYPPPQSTAHMLSGLTGPDEAAARFEIESFDVFRLRMVEVQALWKQRRKVRGTPEGDAIRKKINLLKKAARQDKSYWMGQTLLRRAHTQTGFRERLIAFWADHFTAYGKGGVVKRATSPYIEEAIRSNLTGHFADLLVACVTHPVMLEFLDQHRSVGPNSERSRRSGGKMGMNENLAREVLELHTLGVDGPYAQEDVRQLAELFAGMTYQPQAGFKFRKDFAEPGAETVLGKTYSVAPRFRPIRAVLEDLAAHPATAAHIARKLAVHFVSDAPSPDLIQHLETQFMKTDGDLLALYSALIEHPAAWDDSTRNAKIPADFVGSAMRALVADPARIQAFDEKQARRYLTAPMAAMGQIWQLPTGPDGWSEADSDWITPQGLAARVDWAMTQPRHLVADLPDPRAFVHAALGKRAPQVVQFAAGAAESRSEAIGLVLSSPAFQMR